MSPRISRFVVASAVLAVAVATPTVAQYTPDLCTSANPNFTCNGSMCTYMVAAYFVSSETMAQMNASCTGAFGLSPANPPAQMSLVGAAAGASPVCVFDIQDIGYVRRGYCVMEPADGLPVELLDFDVVEQSPEEGGESERAERASIR